MIWLRLARAAARDTYHAVKAVFLGPYCRVTGEHVYPRDRVDHEHIEHPTEGPCVLI